MDILDLSAIRDENISTEGKHNCRVYGSRYDKDGNKVVFSGVTFGTDEEKKFTKSFSLAPNAVFYFKRFVEVVYGKVDKLDLNNLGELFFKKEFTCTARETISKKDGKRYLNLEDFRAYIDPVEDSLAGDYVPKPAVVKIPEGDDLSINTPSQPVNIFNPSGYPESGPRQRV